MRIIDTYSDFMTYWSMARTESLDQQVMLWETLYMVKYPELLDKQVSNYEKEGCDWREVAKRHIFPWLEGRLALMQEAHNNVLAVCESVDKKATGSLGLDSRIILVIYVGIGCGAGWATQYEGQPACLLGLENIAESKWHTRSKLEGLLAHEFGHLAHIMWRRDWERFELAEQDPLFQLYSEGFAQRCEHVILGRRTWHQAQDKSWVSWCESKKKWLAREFLRRVEKNLSMRDFFGSWFDIKGKKGTGYFLGHDFIRNLEKTHNLRQIALLHVDQVRKMAVRYLKSTSSQTEHTADLT